LTAACPLCGEPACGETRFKGIFRCVRHGAFEWFDRNLLDDVDLIAVYQSYPYNRSIGHDFERMKPAYIRGLRRRILKYHSKTEGLSFLDVGCANGEYLEAARVLGMGPVDGVEVDDEARENAALHGRVFSIMSEVQGQYDVVQCKNVLSNISEPDLFFAGLLERTKPGGVMFLDVLNQFSLVALIKRALSRPGILRPPFVINGFSKDAVAALAKRKKARVAWLGTTYAGSDLLPYRRDLGLVVRGWSTRTIGMASMIASDIILGRSRT
jgi:2-polyprenyl-3-methyl-5-hydroxy-6-metoxy-1,4-benzoquinol methylase